jgi:hypothetical protein
MTIADKKPTRRGDAIFEVLNKKFGMLTIVDIIHTTSVKGKTRRKAKCLCDCGEYHKKLLNISDLERGDMKCCGCLTDKFKSKSQLEDLTNRKFGKLLVLEHDENINKRGSYWKCLCDCGNIKSIKSTRLKNGMTKSCGCYQKCNGSEHWNWKPEISNHDRLNKRGIVKNPLYEEWRKNVYLRDDYTCQITMKRGVDIVAHHLDGWNMFPEKRYIIENGVTLSSEIHKLFHKLYGSGNNTRKQFEEFVENYQRSSNPSQELSRSIMICKSCEG